MQEVTSTASDEVEIQVYKFADGTIAINHDGRFSPDEMADFCSFQPALAKLAEQGEPFAVRYSPKHRTIAIRKLG